jgi:hypothetical protein
MRRLDDGEEAEVDVGLQCAQILRQSPAVKDLGPICTYRSTSAVSMSSLIDRMGESQGRNRM